MLHRTEEEVGRYRGEAPSADTGVLRIVQSPVASREGEVVPVEPPGRVLGREPVDGVPSLTVADAKMSGRHCALEWREAADGQRRLYVCDLQSTNGTFLDGHALRPLLRHPIADGAVLRVGRTLMVYRSAPGEPDGHEDDPLLPGCSPGIRRARRALTGLLAAPTDRMPAIALLGQTGVGKEFAVRWICAQLAAARQKPSVPFFWADCGDHRPHLYTDLVGVTGNTFTGVNARPGLFEQAKGGVLLLDEVGDATPAQQVALLRILQEGVVRREGAVRAIDVSDVVVVVATSQPLDDQIRRNAFRRDLAMRLRLDHAVVLPALGERREDIPLFIRRAAQRLAPAGAPPLRLDANTLEPLLVYPWEGNVRQLSDTIALLVGDRTASSIGSDDLPHPIKEHFAALGPATDGILIADCPLGLDDRRRDIWSRGVPALLATDFNLSRAAGDIGITRQQLHRDVTTLGLSRDDPR